MSRQLDEELAAAAGLLDDDADRSVDAVAVVESRSSARDEGGHTRRRGHYGLLISLLVIVVATVTLFLFGFKEAAVYAIGVEELVERRTELAGRRVRIDGELVPGTLVKRDDPCEYRFVVQQNGQRLDVRFPQCVVPDSFRDRPEGGVTVISEGELEPDGTFVASTITPRCSSRYDPETRTMQPIEHEPK
ncbi:MAG: cytochrome c maturation protein CcmE [Deltaproteobacteria bacterium]|jgi:cytochrome c-type biogenesis protein CcmE|nr:cytochrome c maturation protein CcmE [Deltaproteobacteria bacterium]MBW2534112.1 cytochrome c maturation protein CcmE [Deltaproteobacteria bacterium]